jgi:hypothetical protein
MYGYDADHLHTKFHVPNSNGSLTITIKLKAKYRFHAAAVLLFYIVDKNILPHKFQKLM